MKRKKYIFITGIVLIVIAVAATGYIFVRRNGYTRMQQTEDDTVAHMITNTHITDRIHIAQWEDGVPVADSLIVGKWQNKDNPHWYKVYYDDYDEEQKLFWGKEWDESEDVQEEDLNYHGNGWFRWVKRGNILYECATMDACDVPIHRFYTIKNINANSLVYFEPDHKKVMNHKKVMRRKEVMYHFERVY